MTIRFIGLRCDGCSQPLMDFTTREAYFGSTVGEVHRVARIRGWKCRAWTKDKGQVDCCPDCLTKFNFGSPLAKERVG